MSQIQIIPIPSIKIIEMKDDLFSILLESLKQSSIQLENDDILVIASKVVAVSEENIVFYSSINPSAEAIEIAKKAHMDPEFAQVILDESNGNYTGSVPGAITTLNQYGLLANAGADQSNAGEKQVILLPEDCKKTAEKLHKQILEKIGSYVGIIIADSRTTPLRLGTVGCALATYGFEALLDERGSDDLFGRKMHITVRAIADQLATAAEIVMGETNERTPFAVIKGYSINRITSNEEIDLNTQITAEECMFIGPFVKKQKK
ncbi:MAG: coenzyme F420-0:L-glutamate ligase [Candidatus Heimdallarchaeaceae archaeon]